jgi:uncharacterized repeat protein (TIGR01451 family)
LTLKLLNRLSGASEELQLPGHDGKGLRHLPGLKVEHIAFVCRAEQGLPVVVEPAGQIAGIHQRHLPLGGKRAGNDALAPSNQFLSLRSSRGNDDLLREARPQRGIHQQWRAGWLYTAQAGTPVRGASCSHIQAAPPEVWTGRKNFQPTDYFAGLAQHFRIYLMNPKKSFASGALLDPGKRSNNKPQALNRRRSPMKTQQALPRFARARSIPVLVFVLVLLTLMISFAGWRGQAGRGGWGKTVLAKARPASPVRETIAQKLQSQAKVQVELFVMSQCPFGVRAEEAMAPVLDEFGERVEFKLRFIASPAGEGFASLHGQPEVDENIRQVVMAEQFPEQYFDYVVARAANYRSNDWQPVAAATGIDVQTVERLARSATGKRLFTENIRRANELRVNASPTLYLDGEKYRGRILPLAPAAAAAKPVHPAANPGPLPVMFHQRVGALSLAAWQTWGARLWTQAGAAVRSGLGQLGLPSSSTSFAGPNRTAAATAQSAPAITATKSATLLNTGCPANGVFDLNCNSFVNPGDTLLYSVLLNNTGGEALNVVFTDMLNANLTFKPGSLSATPIAQNDSYQTANGKPLQVAASQTVSGATFVMGSVRDNDVDPMGGVLTITTPLTNSPTTQGGSVTLSDTGAFLYTPLNGFSGNDTFSYTVANPQGKSDTATVTIVVAQPTCTDTVKNGTETDIDCGGITCAPCAIGKVCNVSADCTSQNCSGGICQATVCGNGNREGTEACDDGNTTSGDGCSATCTVETGFNCTGATPSVCTTTCGDGLRAGAEACDDQNTTNGDGCSATCTVESGYNCSGSPSVCMATCGDGIRAGGEACDDNNTANGDGCSAACTVETGFNCAGSAPSVCNAICGDGLKRGSEQCDDGNTTNGDGCSAACRYEATGESEPNNTCVQANGPFTIPTHAFGLLLSGAVASTSDVDYYSFTLPVYADVQFETFDSTGPGSCTLPTDTRIELFAPDCTTMLASNDNGGLNNACSRIIQTRLAPGTYALKVSSSNPISTFNYTLQARYVALCGNGVKEGSEECDGGPGCAASCERIPVCGDNFIDAPETCDDGNTVSGDGCDENCTVTACGNGVLTGSEQCDDGNTVDNDGCSSTCQLETCPAGRGNCDNNFANGCEIDLNTDISNCGNCGNNCYAGAVQSQWACITGTCVFQGCQPGYYDLDGDKKCEYACNFTSPTESCNGLDDNCNGQVDEGSSLCPPTANGTQTCQAGACTLSSCNSGFSNCDNNPSNGCEVNTNTNPNNCGACGNACFVPNGTPSCVNGSCAIGSCNPGFADCNGNPFDGCETNTNNDLNNCGACGVSANDGNQCTADNCLGGARINTPLGAGTPCNQNGGSVCDGAGSCVQCVTASQCPGVDTECQTRTCNAGACGFNFTPSGTPVASQIAGDCKQNQCNGAGGTISANNDADLPNDGNQCTLDVCTNGAPSNPPAAAGTACNQNGGSVCDGAGACVQSLCGNGVRQGSEQCDDNNTSNGDGCSAICQVESGYACTGSPSSCSRSLNESDLAAEADFCNIQFPGNFTIGAGQTTPAIYGRFYETGVTEAAGAAASVKAQLGYGPSGTDPRTNSNWVYVNATFNAQVGNDDEYQATLTAPLVPGTYSYVYRFSFDNGLNYTYADLNGAGANGGLTFEPAQLGTMTVTANGSNLNFAHPTGGSSQTASLTARLQQWLRPLFSAFAAPLSYFNLSRLDHWTHSTVQAAERELNQPSNVNEVPKAVASPAPPARTLLVNSRGETAILPTAALPKSFAGETITVNGSGSGFTLPAGESTTIQFSATISNSFTGGSISNQASVTGANFGPVNSNNLSTTVIQAPSMSKAFQPSYAPVGQTSTLTFTITNPAVNTVALTGVSFTDAFPNAPNLSVANPPNVVLQGCGGTAQVTDQNDGTLAAGDTGLKLSNATVAVGTSCTVSVNVTPQAQGPFVNTSGAVSSANGGAGNPATATLVTNQGPVISGATLPVKAGSKAASFTIATVGDPDQAANTLGLTINGNPATASANGITVSGLAISPAGAVTALIETTCGASNAQFTLTVTDNQNTTSTGTLTVNITPNSPPVLSYNAATVTAGTTPARAPATGPADNGTFMLGSVSVAPNNGGLGVQLNQSNGVVTVLNALLIGTYTVTVPATDNCGATTNAQFTVQVVCPAITVNPATLPNGTAGVAYSQTLSALPAGGGYSFAVSSGTLPPGLMLSSTGALTGTPTQVGNFSFEVTATGFGGCSGRRLYQVQIACPAITLNPATLPNGTVGMAYSQTVGAAPSGSYSFALTAGALPAGLSLNPATGALTGTPTVGGTFSFTVTATGFGQCTGSRAYSLTIVCPPLTLNPTTLPNAQAGASYNQTVTVSPAGAYTFSLLTGNLPPGLNLNAATGDISGSATATGTYNFTLRAARAEGCSGTQAYSLAVSCPTVTVTPSALPGGTVGTAYNQTLGATPSGNYSFSKTSGTLPPGLSLSAAGSLSGTPTSAGSYTFAVQASGFGTCTGSRSYTVTITASCTTITLPSLPATGKVGVSYYGNLAGTSPSGSYTFTLAGGALPPGLGLDNLFAALVGKPTAAGTYNFTLKATRSNGCVGTRDYTVTINSGTAALARSADYDGDGQADLALWSGASGRWQILRSSDQQTQLPVWGGAGDVTLSGDYDGDGQTDLAVFRPGNGTWYVKRSSDGAALVQAWGVATDAPVPGDYDGDGKTDLAVWRPGDGNWYVRRSSDGGYEVTAWGLGTAPYLDAPAPGDYDGDGRTDLAVFRRQTGTWLIKRSSDGQFMSKVWGLGTDVPVAGDYDGDGKSDLAVWRGATGQWFVLRSSNQSYEITTWGAAAAGDVPVAGDYDGDRRADLAVWRTTAQTWYVRCSQDGAVRMQAQGQAGAAPAALNRAP